MNEKGTTMNLKNGILLFAVVLSFCSLLSCSKREEEKQKNEMENSATSTQSEKAGDIKVSAEGWLFINPHPVHKDQDGQDIILVVHEGDAFLTVGQVSGKSAIYACGPIKEGSPWLPSADLYMVPRDGKCVFQLLLGTHTTLAVRQDSRLGSIGLVSLGEGCLYNARGVVSSTDLTLGGVPILNMNVEFFGENKGTTAHKEQAPEIVHAERTVKITLKGNDFYAGDNYLFLAAYDAKGYPVPGFTAVWTNVDLDLSELPDGQYVALALQKDDIWGDHLISVCKGEHKHFVIDPNDIIYPEGKRLTREDGPFMTLSLYRKEGDRYEKVDPMTITFVVSDSSGKDLQAVLSEDKRVIVKNAPKQPIALRLTDDKSNQTIDFKIFPYLRGVSPEVIDCKVYGVKVGQTVRDR